MLDGEHKDILNVPNANADTESQLNSTIAMYEVITRQQPHNPGAQQILAEAYFRVGRVGEAQNIWKRLYKLYNDQGESDSAQMVLDSIRQTEPNFGK